MIWKPLPKGNHMAHYLIREAAEKLGITPKRVRLLCKRHNVEPVRIHATCHSIDQRGFNRIREGLIDENTRSREILTDEINRLRRVK